MDGDEIMDLLWRIQAYWPQFKIHEGDRLVVLGRVWEETLDGVSSDEVRTALASLAADGRQFPPGPHDVRSQVMRDRGLGAPDVDEALDEIFAVAERIGFVQGASYQWSHPAIVDTVQSVGWRTICYDTNRGVLRGQLRQTYESAARRHDTETATPPAARVALEQARVAREALTEREQAWKDGVSDGFCPTCGSGEDNPKDGCVHEFHTLRARAALSAGESDFPQLTNHMED